MEKGALTHLACFALALSVILGGSTLYYANREAQYAAYTQVQHQKSLSQLLNSLNLLETSLEKARYVPEGAMRQTLAADVWKESQLASAALSALPLGDRRLEQIETYISQVGDYAYYLMRGSAYDRATPAEWDALCSLCGNATSMLENLDVLKEQVDTGGADFRAVTAGAADQDGVSGALSKVNDEFPEYASLIYDGPYSDHVSRRKPRALEGQRELTQDEALQKAAQLMGKDPSLVRFSFASEGQIPCYGFTCDTMTATISKQGGLALALTDSRATGESRLTAQQAVEKATAFLNSMGLTRMVPSYHTTYETICTINFAFSENDVIAYPDLVKVGVALDDGSVVRLDTAGYAMNHHQREAVSPAVPLETARQSIPDNLKVVREHLAYIPTTGYNEVFCWEFVCKTEDGGHALVYINCETGLAENLLLLVETETGTLTR